MTTKKTTTKTEAAEVAPAAGHPLVLKGETVMLRPTAKAMMDVSLAFGGLIPALQRVQAYDVNAIGTMVHLALGRPSTSQPGVQATIREVCAGDLTDAALAVSALLSDLIGGSQPRGGAA